MTSVGHSRSSSLVDSGKHSMASNGVLSLPPGQGGRNGVAPRPGGAPIPHIDDILAVPKDIDPNQSVKRLLETAEMALRQAEIARDYNRPAMALKDYIRASIIAVQVIRNHRDYATLKGGREDLTRMHNALLKRISQQDEAFAKIKKEIIADNKRTGVQPSLPRAGVTNGNGTAMSPTKQSGIQSADVSPRTSLSSPTAKARPIVHPKPQSLHGNAIKHGSAGVGAPQDLLARFANLRGPQPSPGQDPRIKTHQIVPPRPMGPRDMPQKPKIGIDSSVPSLPKMPDAIYSPARGSIDTPRLPATTPRGGPYNRTGSSASLNGTPAATIQPQSDYFTPTQSYSNNSIPPVPPSNSAMRIPDGDSITPEELYQAMKGKGSILIIDIRLREDFNEGHIMSSSTICIEPSILLRENPSADAISESLVLSPNNEQSLFERRDKYDLVVFYDQDSEEVPSSPRNSDDLVIVSLHRALVHFNYNKELRNSPKILKGGIDAWIDLMGPASLQSTTATAATKPSHPGRSRNKSVHLERRKSKYVVKSLRPDDVRVWQETLKKDDMDTESSPNFLRTTEDFLRRFPPVSVGQESMVSPVQSPVQPPQPPAKPAYGLSHKVALYSDLPSPPTRPAPALPRPSFTGRSQGAEEEEVIEQTNAAVTRPATKFYTGLNNPGNWCYANSTLQSMLAAPGFGRELADSEWLETYKVPRKSDEKIDHPQFMVRIMSSLFHWMSTGKFQVMKAQTLMDYSRHLCSQGRSIEQFGGTRQLDASEFMSFLITHLQDETNTRRDRDGAAAQPDIKHQSLLRAAIEYWGNHSEYSRSVIDRYWRALELSLVQCVECNTRTGQFNPFEWIPLTVEMGRGMSLEKALEYYTADNRIDDFECDHCHRRTLARQSLRFARLPPIICVVFRRFHYKGADLLKSTAVITWDFNNTDFSPFFINPSDWAGAREATKDPAFTGPFQYECYAVIVHGGSRTDNGHYFAYVRDPSSHDPYAWLCCNDSRVTKVRLGSGDRDDVQDEVFKSGRDRVPYIVFFRRKGLR